LVIAWSVGPSFVRAVDVDVCPAPAQLERSTRMFGGDLRRLGVALVAVSVLSACGAEPQPKGFAVSKGKLDRM